MTETLVLHWDYLWLATIITMATIAHYLLTVRPQGLLTLNGLFVLSQWVMVFWTLNGLDATVPADRTYAAVLSTAFGAYITASTVMRWITPSAACTQKDCSPTISVYKPTFAIRLLLYSSMFVTLIYYRAVGYNVFLQGLSGLASDTSADYTTMRLESYAGSRYLFPGYVNQFKNTILPCLTIVTVTYLFHAQRPRHRLISACLIAVTLIALLGTGQRSPLVLCIFTLLIYMHHVQRDQFARRALAMGGAALPLLLVTTLLLGRSSEALADAGPLETVKVLFSEVMRRFFMDSQWAGQMAFRYTFGLPIQDGAEWAAAILGILPGNEGSTLSSEVFAMLYGSSRGTAPPSLWGSVYYNFGWLGVIAFPVLLGCAFQVVTMRALQRSRLSTFEAVSMAGFVAVTGNWIASGPDYFLNSGALTWAILWVIARHSDQGHLPLRQRETAAT